MKIKEEKGITLIALTVTVIILMVITGAMLFNTRNNISIKKVNNLRLDIENIANKIDDYYLKHGELPILCDYGNKTVFQNIITWTANENGATLNEEINPNDGNEYGVIELEKLGGITLNYGYDTDGEYNTVKTNKSVSNETELFVINKSSHQIYFPHGIIADKIFYYTFDTEKSQINIDKNDYPAFDRNTISEIEEKVNSLNSSDEMSSYEEGSQEKLEAIITKLKNDGYSIEGINNNAVSGITVPSSIKIPASTTYNLTVTLERNPNKDYYAVVNSRYYKINYSSDGITISRTPTDINNTGSGNSSSLSASIKAGSTGTGVSIGTVTGTNIPLTSTAVASGKTTIVVNYGNFTKECDVYIGITPSNEQLANANSSTSFSTKFGKIDIIWLTGTGSSTSDVSTTTPNSPASKLAGMTPVKFASNGTEIVATPTTTSDPEWYSYNPGGAATSTGLPDNNGSYWANAQNADGSLFVWIPRFAYRITYYDVENASQVTNTTAPTGYYDGYGMWKADGTVKYTLAQLDVAYKTTPQTVDYNGDKYIIHPAFTTDTALGGWSTELTGFWTAKYEMSREDYKTVSSVTNWYAHGSGDNGGENNKVSNTIRAVSKPGVNSWRNISIGICYYNALHYEDNDQNSTALKSHLMKNSEWGAVAYLTHSKYGRNGTEIDKNNNNTYITGIGGGSTTANGSADATNTWNTSTGAKASSTGNYYGIYDLSGGAYEYVAAFNDTDSSGYYSQTGTKSNWTAETGLTVSSNGTALATKYSNNSTTNSGTLIYTVGKTGDATKEVYKGSSIYCWNSDCSNCLRSSYPFFDRGGYYDSGSYAGTFYSSDLNGNAYNDNSFRVVLAP